MTEPVSVIIPAYNPGGYLVDALRSVVSQTFEEWACLVVDDGSTQDLEWVRAVDPRISLLRQENAGVSAARNAGTRRTAGRYVAYLDADDTWAADKLALQVAAMEANPDAVLCHTGGSTVDQDGNRIETWRYGRQHSGYRDLLSSPAIGTISVLIRRSQLRLAGPWDESLRYAEDIDLWLRLIQRGPFVYLPQELFAYRQHASNSTRNILPLVRDTEKVYKRQYEAAEARGDNEVMSLIPAICKALRAGWGAAAYDHAREYATHRRFGSAAASLSTALRLNPRYTTRSIARYLLQRA